MKEHRRLLDEGGGNVAVAERRLIHSVDEEFAGVSDSEDMEDGVETHIRDTSEEKTL